MPLEFASGGQVMSSTRDALEAALAANPDDLVAHHAYSDLLTEEGDPRGEYIRLQLAREEGSPSIDRMRSLLMQEDRLFRQHQDAWLGPLAPYMDTRHPAYQAAGAVEFTFHRGWLHGIEIDRLTDPLCRALAGAPIARLMAELTVRSNAGGGARSEPVALSSLARSPNVSNLRRVNLGTVDTWETSSFEDDVGELVSATPRLEELGIAARWLIPASVFAARLPNLRELTITTNNNRFPLGLLSDNQSLGRLEHLWLDLVRFMPLRGEAGSEREPVHSDELRMVFCSPHLMGLRYLVLRLPGLGDAGVEELVGSPILDRLRGLDLCSCDITDEGAELLAAHPAIPRLEYLHLDRNFLSPIGIDALAAVGVRVSERQYYVHGEWSDEDELMEDSDLA